jgi:DNA-binding NtrC family response regulator
VDCGALTADLLENDLFGSEYVGASGQRELSLGKFEQCARGTVLLKDFDMTNSTVQQRILKLLETREFVRRGSHEEIRVDVRVIAAMDDDGEVALEKKTAVLELYHRLSAFQLHVPPLRERREDLPLLLGHFMNRLTRRYGVPAPRFSGALLDACQRHAWPGNLRELENFAKRYLALGDEQAALEALHSHSTLEIASRELPGDGNGFVEGKTDSSGTREKASLKLLVRNAKGETERNAIVGALGETHWNRKAAARLLNISYRGLLYKIQEYGLVPPPNGFSTNGEPSLSRVK